MKTEKERNIGSGLWLGPRSCALNSRVLSSSLAVPLPPHRCSPGTPMFPVPPCLRGFSLNSPSSWRRPVSRRSTSQCTWSQLMTLSGSSDPCALCSLHSHRQDWQHPEPPLQQAALRPASSPTGSTSTIRTRMQPKWARTDSPSLECSWPDLPAPLFLELHAVFCVCPSSDA